ncbi:hypothetical protein, partial [Sphingomonas sp. LH128]|uniref:hypothetical protein n=1 Tax=Sphingomonas sp. LH128 TaxID=473781 RepID=UPI002E12F933
MTPTATITAVETIRPPSRSFRFEIASEPYRRSAMATLSGAASYTTPRGTTVMTLDEAGGRYAPLSPSR